MLVIEHGLAMMRKRGEHESFTVVLDTRGGGFLDAPPPVEALRGLATLLQRAYPDRVQHIFAGPVGVGLRGLYGLVRPFLAGRSVQKITLLRRIEDAPLHISTSVW